jgi:LmbE family N-acetylglucosaminyl deacetylase
MKILVVAAHPDDEVLGCGGLMARCANEGHEVYSMIVGEGFTARYDSRDAGDRSPVDDLFDQARAVGRFLGAREVFLAKLPDLRFDTLPILDITKRIEEVVGKIRPDTVLTHSKGDLNNDHAIVHRATMAAVRPMDGSPVKTLRTFEVFSSTEWGFGQFGSFIPNWFFDVGTTLEKKIAAMAMYPGEIRPFPHPRSREAIEAAARRWGSQVGLGAAEPFQTVFEIR